MLITENNMYRKVILWELELSYTLRLNHCLWSKIILIVLLWDHQPCEFQSFGLSLLLTFGIGIFCLQSSKLRHQSSVLGRKGFNMKIYNLLKTIYTARDLIQMFKRSNETALFCAYLCRPSARSPLHSVSMTDPKSRNLLEQH